MLETCQGFVNILVAFIHLLELPIRLKKRGRHPRVAFWADIMIRGLEKREFLVISSRWYRVGRIDEGG